jgi:hypothetical protein
MKLAVVQLMLGASLSSHSSFLGLLYTEGTPKGKIKRFFLQNMSVIVGGVFLFFDFVYLYHTHLRN